MRGERETIGSSTDNRDIKTPHRFPLSNSGHKGKGLNSRQCIWLRLKFHSNPLCRRKSVEVTPIVGSRISSRDLCRETHRWRTPNFGKRLISLRITHKGSGADRSPDTYVVQAAQPTGWGDADGRSVVTRGDRGEPVRIVMVAARYLPFVGGIETHIHEVGARMAAFGHQITVLTTDPTGDQIGRAHV